jgi:predicted anti-sigma-YlaC factor YlaD
MKRVSWITLILGIWLVISPFAFGSTVVNTAAGNNVVLGVLLIGSSWWILAASHDVTGLSWFQMLCGVWLVVAPFVLQYGATRHSALNDVVVGGITFLVGLAESVSVDHRPMKTA